MIVLVNRFLLRKKFLGIALWPFIILREKDLKKDMIFLNHEKIHLRQQIELLVIFFYVWYGIEYLIRLLQYKNTYKAYLNISFEREAYIMEQEINFLKTRPIWNFLKYL
jgi:hypothetical protein